ncbi:MAG: hypothetical protein PHR26_03510 [Candidatus ainarchaeum sp.]|nr:hypothetical protein [Candidatus ainarchaeum sp.]MDD3975614.1 hypothetical protein [Candidatus ainarchaeum sp.]
MAIKKDILNYIINNPSLTSKQIIQNNKYTEITIKKIIFELLEEKQIKLENGKYYSINYIDNKKQIIDKDTFFGIYVKQEHKDIIKYLFREIRNNWIKYNNKEPDNTQIYKILVEINNISEKIDLPIVWYKFGQIPVISYNINDLENIKEINGINSKDIIKSIFKNLKRTSKEIKLKQYTSGSTNMHTIYSFKERIIERFFRNDFKFIKDNFKIFFKKLPYMKDPNKTLNRFYEFICMYNKLDKNKQINPKYKDLFNKLFTSFWNIVAIYNFKHDIKNYYIKNNIDINIDNNFKFKLQMEVEEFNNLLSLFETEYLSTENSF